MRKREGRFSGVVNTAIPVKGDKALIHNPDGRSTNIILDEVSKHFTGVALELRPGDNFEGGKQRERLKLSQLWQRMTGFKRAIAQILVLTLVLQAFVLALRYYMQVAIDNALPALDLDLLAVLAIGFGLFTLIKGSSKALFVEGISQGSCETLPLIFLKEAMGLQRESP